MKNKKQVVWKENDEGTFSCDCGNTAWSDGYQPCNDKGEEVEPNKDWGGLYVCGRCKTIGLYEDCAEPCEHDWIDDDNEGSYGKEVCRFCGEKQKK